MEKVFTQQVFEYCPRCSDSRFADNGRSSKKCQNCGFVYYFNPIVGVSCFIREKDSGSILVARRGNDPQKGMLDLPGGFVDQTETAEEAVKREVSEETGLRITDMKYLFSFPNTYHTRNYTEHILDLFFDCTVDSIQHFDAADDVAELTICQVENININDLAFESTRRAMAVFKKISNK